MNHEFFAGIDWAKLERKEYEAPFKPVVKSQLDISQIDPAFTKEAARDSVVLNHSHHVVGDEFEDFSFVAPSAINRATMADK